MQAQNIPRGYCQCGCGQMTKPARQSTTALGHVRGEPVRFIQGHTFKRNDPQYRVEDRGYETPCWVWQWGMDMGYGKLGKRRAHVVMYEREHGPVPKGMHVDHLCCNRVCVNPTHLEAVTPRENRRRGGQERLTHAQVAEIRKLLAEGLLQVRIAEMFGVSPSHVSRINTRDVWRAGEE